VAVQIPASEIYEVTTIFLRHMQRNDPLMQTQHILQIVKNTADMHNLKISGQQQKAA